MSKLATREPTQAEAKAAHDVDKRIRTCVRTIRREWLRLAENLFAFKEAEQWRDLGLPSFNAYLADPELEIEPRYAYSLLEIWRELVVNRGVSPDELADIGVSKAQKVLPAIRRGYVDLPDALASAKVLKRDDLRREFAPSQNPDAPPGAPVANDHRIVPEDEPEFAQCEACGSMYRVRR